MPDAMQCNEEKLQLLNATDRDRFTTDISHGVAASRSILLSAFSALRNGFPVGHSYSMHVPHRPSKEILDKF